MMDRDACLLQSFTKQNILVAVIFNIFVEWMLNDNVTFYKKIRSTKILIGIFLAFCRPVSRLIFLLVLVSQVVRIGVIAVIYLQTAHGDTEVGIQVFLYESGALHHDVAV